jgi:hypothetical protein
MRTSLATQNCLSLHLDERFGEGSIWDQTLHVHGLNLFDSVGLTASETQRYSRHLVLPEVGPEGQRRLKRSSVLVVGLGASTIGVRICESPCRKWSYRMLSRSRRSCPRVST